MNLFRICTTGLVAVLLLPALALAGTVTHDASGTSIEIPEDWNHHEDGEGNVHFVNADATARIMLCMLEADTLEDGMDEAMEFVTEAMGDVQLGDDIKELDTNGMVAHVRLGEAVLDEGDGPTLVLAVGVVDAPCGIVMMLGGYDTAAEDTDALNASLNRICGSLAPAFGTIELPGTGLFIDVPATCDVLDEEDALYVGIGEEAVVIFTVCEIETLEELDEVVSGLFEDIGVEATMMDAEEHDVNGLPAMASHGTGVSADGEECFIGFLVIECPTGRTLVVLGLLDPEAEAAGEVAEEIVESLRDSRERPADDDDTGDVEPPSEDGFEEGE